MKKIYKIDLHTHSILSYDGGINESGYRKIFKANKLDYIAIADHNEIDFALMMQKKLGDRIIVGEEIMTKDGEIIGLFLNQKIHNNLSIKETIGEIRKQNGLVYIPHPFETKRKGVVKKKLLQIVQEIDIIEIFNARGFGRDKKAEVMQFAQMHNLIMTASSDSHCMLGIGSAFASMQGTPRKDTIKQILRSAKLHMSYAHALSYFCPSINKVKKKVLNHAEK